jgi:hypothetical protein
MHNNFNIKNRIQNKRVFNNDHEINLKVMLRFKITLNVKLTNELRQECNWRLQAYTQKHWNETLQVFGL